MGYDMHVVRKDAEEEKLVRQLQQDIMEAIAKRDALPKEYAGTYAPGEFERKVGGGLSPMKCRPDNQHPKYTAAQAEIDRLSGLREAAERSYFRLKIWEMARYRTAMLALGVARQGYPHPSWPEFDKARTCWILTEESVVTTPEGDKVREHSTRVMDPYEWFDAWRSEPKWRPDDYVEPGPDVVKLFQEHEAAIKATLAWRPDPQDDFRIPLHKLGTNDGWLVTEEECFFAGNTLQTTREAKPEQFYAALGAAGITDEEGYRYFNRWIEYLLYASERGGFKVY